MQAEAIREVAAEPPLTLPRELWVTLSSEHQAACRSAEGLLDVFGGDRSLPLREIFARTELGVEQTLAGLKVLDGMALVTIETAESGPTVKLRATPEEHLRIVGPDGHVRWLLVARPLEPPVVAPLNLN